MHVNELAAQLRRRLKRLGELPDWQINATPDRVIIEGYSSCTYCGKRHISSPPSRRNS
jgi:hypothetical protein